MIGLAPRPKAQSALPPALGGGLPLLGHALAFARDPVALLRGGQEQLGNVFSFRLLTNKVAVLLGPKANEAYFRASETQLSARAAYRFTIPLFGKGIAYDAAPARMEEQIDLFYPALTEQRLRTYADVFTDEAEQYLDRLGDAGEISLNQLTNELTVFIASRCLIGREFRQNLSEEFAHLYHDLEGGINLLAFFHPFLPLPSFKRRDRARVRMVEIIGKIIAGRRQRGAVEEDFLQTLMTARYADGTTLNDDQITGMLLTLIFAGQHTSAALASWLGVELLRHRQFLPDILTEQERLVGDRPLTYEALREMTFLERAMQETERLHPPLIMLFRKVVEEFAYQDYRIPPGWMIMVSAAVSHRLPEVFTDPDRFDPERLAPGREEHRKQKFSLITFGGGKHACIGMNFAYLQIKAIWSALLRRYDVELIDPDPQPNYATFVVVPREPCRVRYKRQK